MSGEHRATVTVDRSMLEGLHRSEGELRRLRNDIPELLQDIHIRSQHELRSRLAPLEARQVASEREAQRLRSEIRDVEVATARALADEHRWVQEQLDDVSVEIADLAETTARMLQDQREALDQRIDDVQSQVDDVVAREEHMFEMARNWLHDAEAKCEEIRRYRHADFAPGALESLAADVQLASQNAAQGASEAALVQSQAAYRALAVLALELEHSELQWNLWRSRSIEDARALLALAQQNRTCDAVDFDGKPLDFACEVDFWTNGELSARISEITALVNQLETDESCGIQMCERELIERQLGNLRQQVEDLTMVARAAVLNSQLRTNLAGVAVEVLEREGFQLAEDGFEAGDMREAMVAKLRHRDGGEVVVRVSPNQQLALESNLQIHSYDVEMISDSELRQRQEAIWEALRNEGLGIGAQECIEKPDSRYKDLSTAHGRHREQRHL